jgi:hypothetical protein
VPMPLRHGVHQPLEDAADELIRLDLKRHTRPAENDVLTPWKEANRRRREVYVVSGVPDPAVRKGCFHRVVNPGRPELNSREGIAPPRHSGALGEHSPDWDAASWVDDQ